MTAKARTPAKAGLSDRGMPTAGSTEGAPSHTARGTPPWTVSASTGLREINGTADRRSSRAVPHAPSIDPASTGSTATASERPTRPTAA